MISPNPSVDRLILVPAYPTCDRFGPINRDHLLLANVPRQELTVEQRRRRDHHLFHQPFAVIDHTVVGATRPFLIYFDQQLYGDLARRFQVDNAILDCNYERLRQCLNVFTQERIRHGLLSRVFTGLRILSVDRRSNFLYEDMYISRCSSFTLQSSLNLRSYRQAVSLEKTKYFVQYNVNESTSEWEVAVKNAIERLVLHMSERTSCITQFKLATDFKNN